MWFSASGFRRDVSRLSLSAVKVWLRTVMSSQCTSHWRLLSKQRSAVAKEDVSTASHGCKLSVTSRPNDARLAVREHAAVIQK